MVFTGHGSNVFHELVVDEYWLMMTASLPGGQTSCLQLTTGSTSRSSKGLILLLAKCNPTWKDKYPKAIPAWKSIPRKFPPSLQRRIPIYHLKRCNPTLSSHKGNLVCKYNFPYLVSLPCLSEKVTSWFPMVVDTHPAKKVISCLEPGSRIKM